MTHPFSCIIPEIKELWNKAIISISKNVMAYEKETKESNGG
jgi:hypothetical protein